MIFIDRSISVSKKTAYGGILSALVLISLYLSYILPTTKLFFLALSSVFIAAALIELDILFAIIIYLATSALSFFLIPLRAIVLLYVLFFGMYAVIKLIAEQLKSRVLSWATKIVFFNIALFIIYNIASLLVIDLSEIKLPMYAIIIISELLFILYDYVYSMAISYYIKRIKH